MKLIVTLAVSLGSAVAGLALGRAFAPVSAAVEPRLAAGELEALALDLTRGEERLGTLSAASARFALAPALPASTVPDDAELEAALARWRAAHPEVDSRVAAGRGEVSGLLPNGLDLATMPVAELVHELHTASIGDPEREEIFQKLRDLGRIDEYVAEVERLAAEDPENPALQVALGNAYLQQLFGLGSSPEVGAIAWKSDRAFDRALELDETGWEARFTKAVALSNWPAFLGRGSEAIEQFEILIDQQESQPAQPHFALPYLFLGNMLQASGELQEAIATWKEGLKLFPEDEGLEAALAAAGIR